MFRTTQSTVFYISKLLQMTRIAEMLLLFQGSCIIYSPRVYV
nr:MAG TPA: Condensin II complex subunit [Bacteriophage sp.]